MFQTKVVIPKSAIKISYEDHIMTLGSCFAENMGIKMKDTYFETDINPFGVLYNPISILNSIELLLQNKKFTQKDIFEHDFRWKSFSHSSLFDHTSAEECLDMINTKLKYSNNFLKQTNVLLITFGTAWVFEEKKSGRVVSNCHKLPASEFVRRRLTVEEIVTKYSEMIFKLQSLFPNLKLIFSVSPIRHWKDGAHENNISKSILLLAIDELQKKFESIHYFQAYEIQLDELRDYRFYAPDMLHPSEVAIDYIWQRFSETYFTEQTLQLKKRLEQLATDLAHRPFQPESLEYKRFQATIENKRKEITTEYPFLTNRIN